jgi:hypothetical protein
MQDAILGPPPHGAEPPKTPIESSLGMRSVLAQTFMEHNIGNPADIAVLSAEYDKNGDGILEVPPDVLYDPDRDDFQGRLETYFSNMSGPINDPLALYEQAYRDALR